MMKAVVTSFLLLTLPYTLLAADTNAAMLINSGSVEINGQQAPRTSTIFPGDRIKTGPNSTAQVKVTETVISVRNDSSVQYRGDNIVFERGVVAVKGAKGPKLQFGDLTISAERPAKFVLIKKDGEEKLAALEGPLNITSGGRNFTLNQGQMMTRMLPAESNGGGTTSGQPANDAGQATNQNPGVIAQATSSGFFGNWKVGAIVGLVAIGAVAGAGFAGAFDTQQASPSKVR